MARPLEQEWGSLYKFLKQFNDIHSEGFIPGRAAVLRLKGPQGALDIRAVYITTGIAAPLHAAHSTPQTGSFQDNIRMQRQHTRLKIASATTPATHALTVLTGDFNWVTNPKDINSKFSVTRDEVDERHWDTHVARPFQFHGLHQPMFTHSSYLVRSRLDRVYWNQHISE